MKKILWEEETSLVIARTGRIGVILLVVYVAYVIFRHQWLAYWFYGHKPQLSAIRRLPVLWQVLYSISADK